MPLSCVRILVLGDTCVGKTSLVSQFAEDKFDPNSVYTMGVDYAIKVLQVNGQQIKVQIWDTAGQERFHSITDSYYRNAHAAMLVYDITKVNSFANIPIWLERLSKYHDEDLPKVLVANKADLHLQRAITQVIGKVFADEHNLEFFESCAKTKENVDEPFIKLVEKVLEQLPYQNSTAPPDEDAKIKLKGRKRFLKLKLNRKKLNCKTC